MRKTRESGAPGQCDHDYAVSPRMHQQQPLLLVYVCVIKTLFGAVQSVRITLITFQKYSRCSPKQVYVVGCHSTKADTETKARARYQSSNSPSGSFCSWSACLPSPPLSLSLSWISFVQFSFPSLQMAFDNNSKEKNNPTNMKVIIVLFSYFHI